MAKPWMDEIKARKSLTIHASEGFRESAIWGAKFLSDAVDEFNRIVTAQKIAFTLKETETPSDRDGLGGADIEIGVSAGKHLYYAFGKNDGTLPPGSTMNARTHLSSYSKNAAQPAKLAKASIFVNQAPLIGGLGDEGQRTPGRGILMYIVLHEFLHALGLENDDPGHNSAAKPDVFRSFVSVDAGDPPDGAAGKPGDRISLGGNTYMPKFYLLPGTAKLINSIWR